MPFPVATIEKSGRFALGVFQARGPRNTELDLLQFAMPISLGVMGLMRRGSEEHGIRPQSHINLFTALAEGALSSFLLTKVRWAYLLIASGWTAYEMGGVPTLNEKIKTLFKGAILFGSGAMGVRIGEDLRSYLRRRDAHETVNALRKFDHYKGSYAFSTLPEEVKQTFNQFEPEMAQLAQANDKLRHGAFNTFTSDSLTEAGLKDLSRHKTTAYIHDSEARLLEKIRRIPSEYLADLSHDGQLALENVIKYVKRSHSIGWFRRTQPMLGYLTVMSFIGFPLASSLDRLIRTNKTGFQRHELNHFIAPLYLGRTLNAFVKPTLTSSTDVIVPLADGPALLTQSNA